MSDVCTLAVNLQNACVHLLEVEHLADRTRVGATLFDHDAYDGRVQRRQYRFRLKDTLMTRSVDRTNSFFTLYSVLKGLGETSAGSSEFLV